MRKIRAYNLLRLVAYYRAKFEGIIILDNYL